MNKILKQVLIIFFLIAILILPYFVFAAPETNTLKTLRDVGETSGPYSTADEATFAGILGTGVKAALSLLGVVFIILIIYGGYTWMTASGEEEKVKKAQHTIQRALIGLIIVISAYTIWEFVAKYVIYD